VTSLGAAFGTVEDYFIYNLPMRQLDTAMVRAFVSVPLHCGTALIMGVTMADQRFLGGESQPWCVRGLESTPPLAPSRPFL
jgi:hypothetical protein